MVVIILQYIRVSNPQTGHLPLCHIMDCSLPGSSVHGIFPGKSPGVGCHFLLQGIFPAQRSNPGLPHGRQTLYHLSQQGSYLPLTMYQSCLGNPWCGERRRQTKSDEKAPRLVTGPKNVLTRGPMRMMKVKVAQWCRLFVTPWTI